MDSVGELASEAEVVKVVRSIVSVSDLSKVTSKQVRIAVIEQLGPRLGDDPARIKEVVKSALNVVLAEPPSEKVEATQVVAPAKVDPVLSKAGVPAKADRAVPKGESESKSNGDNGDAGSGAVSNLSTRPVKRARKRIVENFFEDDENDDDDPAAGSTVKDVDFAAPAVKDKDEAGKDSEVDDDYVNGDGGDDDPDSPPEEDEAPKRKRKRTSQGSTEKGAQMSAAERQLTRYKKIAREIGCPVPPSVFRNKSTISEKRLAVIKYLQDKGFDVLNGANLNKSSIEEFRHKVDQQKELAALDVSNIIGEDEGRPRRRRARVSYADPAPPLDEEDGEDDEEMTPEEDSPDEEESEGYVGSGPSDDDE